MRIAFVAQPWDRIVPPVTEGSSIAIVTYELARRLARSHRVAIYTRRALGEPRVETDELGIEFRRVSGTAKMAHRFVESLPGVFGPGRPFFASSLYYAPHAIAVARSLGRERFDVVHTFGLPQHLPILRRFDSGSRLVLHMQGESLSQLDPDVVEPQLSHADLVLGCSEYITRTIRERFPSLAPRVRTLYNGVDGDRFTAATPAGSARAESRKRALFVGRVSPEKGIHVLLEAHDHVRERVPEAQLEIVGPKAVLPLSLHVALSRDPYVRALSRFYGGWLEGLGRRVMRRESRYSEELEARLGACSKHVRFRGSVDNADLGLHYRRADVFVFPSVWPEPFGMPIVEAMACGIPVVATRAGGIPEIVEDGHTGLLVDRENPVSLARAIEQLFGDEGLRRAMGERGRERALASFSWDRIARELEEHYRRVLG